MSKGNNAPASHENEFTSPSGGQSPTFGLDTPAPHENEFTSPSGGQSPTFGLDAPASHENEFTSPSGGQSPTFGLDAPASQGWDWVWLYFCGTVLLGMSEQEFWRTTPRKLAALMNKYAEVNGLGEEQENQSNAEAFGQLMEM